MLEDDSRWSFRRRARAWLSGVSRGAGSARTRAFESDGQRVLVMESARLSAGQTVDGFLLVRGDFSCGAGCRFLRSIYVAGNCEIGKGSVLETVEADGSLYLGPSVEVKNVAGCQEKMEIRSGSRIGATAYSQTSIHLGLQAEAGELYAPLISTPTGVLGPFTGNAAGYITKAIELRSPGGPVNRGALRISGFDPRRLRPIREDTWMYDGDLHLLKPILLRSNLVVNGAFSCPAGSLLEANVRSAAGLALGAGTVAEGDLHAGGDLLLAANCVFQGVLESSQMIRLGSAVRGMSSGKPVRVRAAGQLVLEEDVVIRGRLSSSCQVVARAGEVPLQGGRRVAGGSL